MKFDFWFYQQYVRITLTQPIWYRQLKDTLFIQPRQTSFPVYEHSIKKLQPKIRIMHRPRSDYVGPFHVEGL